MSSKTRAPRNRTITLSDSERASYRKKLITLTEPTPLEQIKNSTVWQDSLTALQWMPAQSIDLVFADPPYNLTKTFNKRTFTQTDMQEYADWLERWVSLLPRILKPTATIYICGDWRSSPAIYEVTQKYFQIQNRITWEREKGRGAKTNWKNCSEDIWFCTMSNNYVFNVDAVRLKRQVMAPYTNKNGDPKDWQENEQNQRFRLTAPSNLWTDLSVPFWSMPENTDHPTQKPEKLLAKVILASSNEGDIVFDPFLGSGTTSVVAKKLKRHYIGVEVDEMYCCLAEKRLEQVNENNTIQGYANGVFWERNTLKYQKQFKSSSSEPSEKKKKQLSLF